MSAQADRWSWLSYGSEPIYRLVDRHGSGGAVASVAGNSWYLSKRHSVAAIVGYDAAGDAADTRSAMHAAWSALCELGWHGLSMADRSNGPETV